MDTIAISQVVIAATTAVLVVGGIAAAVLAVLRDGPLRSDDPRSADAERYRWFRDRP